eukprot:354575-Chlamydomonas_euryale.AAC.3
MSEARRLRYDPPHPIQNSWTPHHLPRPLWPMPLLWESSGIRSEFGLRFEATGKLQNGGRLQAPHCDRKPEFKLLGQTARFSCGKATGNCRPNSWVQLRHGAKPTALKAGCVPQARVCHVGKLCATLENCGPRWRIVGHVGKLWATLENCVPRWKIVGHGRLYAKISCAVATKMVDPVRWLHWLSGTVLMLLLPGGPNQV